MKFIILFTAFIYAGCLSGQQIEERPIGYGLLVGVEDAEVDGFVYNSVSTIGYLKSVKRIKKLLKKEGFNVDGKNIVSLTNNPSKTEIITILKEILSKLRNKDLFVFYFFGHGDQIKDERPFDEKDDLDEVLVANDDYIVDDEIRKIISSSNPAARILVIVDACNSGSSHTLSNTDYENFKEEQYYEEKDRSSNNLIYFGATTDMKKVRASSSGGYFTKTLVRVWKSGKYKGDYLKFYEDVFEKSNKDKFYPVIDTSNTEDYFKRQKPFKIN